MSELSPDRLNFDELIARIERQQAETREFVAEQHRLAAEAGRPTRDRWLAPVIALAFIVAACGARLAAYGSLTHLFGRG